MKTKKRKLWMIPTLLAGCILVLVIVNSLTYRPFMWAFRSLLSHTTIQGNPGDWLEEIENVKEIGTENIPVAGYPDAKAYLFAPDGNATDLPLIIYIHGGGWCTGTAESVEWYAKLLASNGYAVANIDYSLAPEYPYPAAIMQLTETVNFLYENADKYGYNRECIFIGGNSAGANLSSQLGAIFTNAEYADTVGVDQRVPSESIKGLVLYNGVYNFDTVGDCHFPFSNKLAWAYTGMKKYKKYERIDELSTVKHITENYPAVFLTVGDSDPLESQTLEFVDALKKQKIDCAELLWSGTKANLWHDYIYEQDTEEGKKAYEDTISFLKSH